jgi:hypothetical protein
MHPHDRAELEAAEAECPECGGDTRTGYDCHCDELEPAAQDDGQDEEDRQADDAIQAYKDDRAMGYRDPEPDHEDHQADEEDKRHG